MGCSICGSKIDSELKKVQKKELGWTEGAVCEDHLLEKLKSMDRNGFINVDWDGIKQMIDS